MLLAIEKHGSRRTIVASIKLDHGAASWRIEPHDHLDALTAYPVAGPLRANDPHDEAKRPKRKPPIREEQTKDARYEQDHQVLPSVPQLIVCWLQLFDPAEWPVWYVSVPLRYTVLFRVFLAFLLKLRFTRRATRPVGASVWCRSVAAIATASGNSPEQDKHHHEGR
jgi:hypothetical protein